MSSELVGPAWSALGFPCEKSTSGVSRVHPASSVGGDDLSFEDFDHFLS